jgi:hypothetical protein
MTMLAGFANTASDPTGAPDAGPSARPSQELSPQPSVQTAQQISDQVVENAALSGAAAIRRIIGERNELRLERERLTAVNEELRSQIRKITKVRDYYVQLVTELVTQIKHINNTIRDANNTIRDAVQKTHWHSTETEDRDDTLVAMARRFSPPGPGSNGERD